MTRLSASQLNYLESHRLADDELLKSEVFRNHDPHGEAAKQISIRTDRGVVA